jgi:hypothetical protein
MTARILFIALALSVLVLFVLSLLTGPAGFGPGKACRHS